MASIVNSLVWLLIYAKKVISTLINLCDFDVCELVPQFIVHSWKEHEKLQNIVELGNN